MLSSENTSLCDHCKKIFIKPSSACTSLFSRPTVEDFLPMICPICAHIYTFLRSCVQASGPNASDRSFLLGSGIDQITYHFSPLPGSVSTISPSFCLVIDIVMRDFETPRRILLPVVPKNGEVLRTIRSSSTDVSFCSCLELEMGKEHRLRYAFSQLIKISPITIRKLHQEPHDLQDQQLEFSRPVA